MLEDGPSSQDEKLASWRFLRQIEVNQTLTALYLIIEASRWQRSKGEDGSMRKALGSFNQFCVRTSQLTHTKLASHGPCILTVLTKIIAKLRWEETSYIPLPRVCCQHPEVEGNMLTWKLKDCSPLLENDASTFWQYERNRREQSRAASRYGH